METPNIRNEIATNITAEEAENVLAMTKKEALLRGTKPTEHSEFMDAY